MRIRVERQFRIARLWSNREIKKLALLFIESHNTRKWKEKMPKFEPIREAGKLISFRWSFKELKQKILQRR
jgi:hypothetical protein